MLRVVHYTTGYHWPPRGGIETAINSFAAMTYPLTENWVFCKNAEASYANGMRGAPCSNRVDRDFDSSTHTRLTNLKPDVVIVYESADGPADIDMMRVFYGKSATYGKIARLQFAHRIDTKFFCAADQIWCFSNNLADLVRHRCATAEVRVIPRAYDSVVFNLDHRRQPSENATIQLLYVGRIAPVKRVDQLLEVVAKISQDRRLRLRIIGSGTPPAETESVLKFIEEHPGLASYHGWRTPDHVASVMKRSDILVVPSRWESFCAAAMEALACGCVVVDNTPSNSGLAGWIGTHAYRGHALPPGELPQAEDLEVALREAIADQVEWSELSRLRMAERNSMWVKSGYSFDAVAPRVREALDPWIGSRSESPA